MFVGVKGGIFLWELRCDYMFGYFVFEEEIGFDE